MYIQKVSLPSNVNYLSTVNKKNEINAKTIQNAPINLNLTPSFLGTMYNFVPVSDVDFQKQGGKFYFDKAQTKSSMPYSGRIVSDSKNMQIVSSYKDGTKASINIAWNQRDDMDDISINLKKDGEILNQDKTKTIVWTNALKDIEYMEMYDACGRLFQTSLVGYKSATDNTVVMSIQRDYEFDGITPYREQTDVADEFKSLFGYSSRIAFQTHNGTKEICFDVTSKDKSRTAKKRTVFYDVKGKINKASENDVIYFDKKTNAECAMSDERIVFRNKSGKLIARDYGFRTLDYTKNVNQLRKFMYDEHPMTVRDIDENVYTYYDGITKKRFALEQYEQGKELPVCILNFDKKCAAEVKNPATNILLINIFANFSKKAASMLFQKQGDNYTIKQMDVFSSETETRKTTKRFYSDGTTEIMQYDEEGALKSKTVQNTKKTEE